MGSYDYRPTPGGNFVSLNPCTVAAVFLVFGITLFAAFSCSSVRVDTDTKQVVAKIAARTLGYEAAKRYPEVVAPARLFCQVVATAENGGMADALKNQAVVYLTEKVEMDPILWANLRLLVEDVRFEGDPDLDLQILKFVAAAFAEGLEMAAAMPAPK